jgi:O-antigen/teichoic acid export membrane protein
MKPNLRGSINELINKYKNILNTSKHKKELLIGSIQTIFIKIIGLLIGYAFIMLLSRNYGANTVGVYNICLQFITVSGLIVLLGFNQSIVRYSAQLVASKNIAMLVTLIKKITVIIFVFALIGSITIYMYSTQLAIILFKEEQLTPLFMLLSFILPVFALNILFIEAIRGFKKIIVSEFLRLFSTKLFTLLIFLFALCLVKFNTYLPFLSFVVATVMTFVVSTYFLIKFVKEFKKYDISGVNDVSHISYISTSFTMYQSIMFITITNQVVIMILAYFTTPASVGIYSVALQLAALSTFAFSAVITITGPRYSELFHNSSKEDFQETVLFCSKLVFWTSGSTALFTIIFSPWLMGMFGDEFKSGSLILIVLSLGNFINAFTGTGGLILDMTGKQSIRRNITLLGILIVLPLCFIVIPHYGGIGLALIILINQIIGNFASVYYVRKILGINIFYLPIFNKRNLFN